MKQTPDVLIVGGGIIGLTSAFLLARAGKRVVVWDRQTLGREASWAGAGILPPGNFEAATSPLEKLRAYTVERLEEFTQELKQRTSIDTGYARCGGIEFLPEDDHTTTELWRQEKIRFERWSDRILARRESRALTPPGTIPYHLPDCAQLRNPWHLRALKTACRQLKVELMPDTEAASWAIQDGRAELRDQHGTAWPAEQYLLAAGAWTGGLAEKLGLTLPIRPIRGQIVLYRPYQPLLQQVLMLGKRYLVPRADGRILAGSTEEPEAGFDRTTTPEAIAELQQFAAEIVPELDLVEVEAVWSGLRPACGLGGPVIGRLPGFPNIVVAAGHFRSGVQLSLGTAELVRALVMNEEPIVPLEPFRWDRPADDLIPLFRS